VSAHHLPGATGLLDGPGRGVAIASQQAELAARSAAVKWFGSILQNVPLL
jgi:hypothetical protein